MKRLALLVVLLVAAPSRVPIAAAQESPPVTAVGRLGSGSLGTGVGGPGGSSSGNQGSGTPVVPVASNGGGGSSRASGTPSPYQVSRDYDVAGNDLVGPIGQGCSGPDGQRGVRYIDTVTDSRTGGTVSQTGGCQYPGSAVPGADGTTPRPPPPPPTPDEIWADTPLPLPAFGVNPSINGLTGLPTWLWDPSGGAPVTATASIRGYTSNATARPIHYEWRMWQSGDTPNVNPFPIVGSDRPGSEATPAATYMYETHGDFTITATVTWAGTYTYSGAGVGTTTNSLGTTTRTATRAYHVDSVRAARVG